MADFRFPLSQLSDGKRTSTHVSVNPFVLKLTTNDATPVSYDGHEEIAVDLTALTVNSANKLSNARTIAISGAVTGTATSFNGTANIVIPTTAIDVSKANAGTLVTERGGTGNTSYTKNRLLYTNTATKFASAGSLESDGAYLHIVNNTDVGGTAAGTSAPFAIGTLTSQHIEIDNNEILSKSNDKTPGTLYLQDSTGIVQVAGSGGLAVTATTATSSYSTGAVRVSGGIGAAGNIWSNSNIVANGSLAVSQTGGTSGYGLSLYGGSGNVLNYGIFFGKTATYGTHGNVTSDWATYFTMDGATTRGWIFRKAAATATNVASISANGRFTGTLAPSSWLDGQRYLNAAYNIADYSNTGSYNPWMRATNTWSSGADTAKVGRWFSFGTLGSAFYWGGSQTTRTANSFEYSMNYNVANGQLSVNQVNSYLNGTALYARLLENKGGATVTIENTAWGHGHTPNGHTNGATVWYQRWKQSGLTYTPSGGSATAVTDSADMVYWLSSSNTANTLQLNMALDGNIYILGQFKGAGGRFGYDNYSYALSASSAIINSWIRTTGETGWYSQTHGGGWYMTDNNFIRMYANKQVAINSTHTTSATNLSSQLIVGSVGYAGADAAGGATGIELWRGTNASWQIANDGGVLYIRNNYTTARQTTYSVNSLILDYNTGAASLPYLALGQTARSTSYRLYVNGNTLHNGIIYLGNGTTYYIDNSAIGYLNDLRVDNTRLIDNWLGFYSAVNAGGSRYGYIQGTQNVMYFRKENQASGVTAQFDFNGIIQPSATNTFDLGTSALRWRNLYMQGNIVMQDMGTPASYPATSNKITWSGGTDGAQLYYVVQSADAGRLFINTTDDANCLVAMAYNGTAKAYFNNSTPSFYPATTNTGTIGTSGNRWQKLYVGTANTYGDAYTPVFWNAGVPQAITVVQYSTWQIKSGHTKSTLTGSGVFTANSYVIALVVTSGESNLNAPLTWTTNTNSLVISTSTATSGEVNGYVITARGGATGITATSSE